MMTTGDTQTIIQELAVIIPYYEGARFLEACLSSIRESAVLPCCIYVVDNDPTGLTLHTTAISQPGIIIVRTKPSIGFGRAVNLAVTIAIENGQSVFLILNQDTRLHPQCIGSLIESHRSAGQPALISPMICSYDTYSLSPHFVKYTLTEQTSYHTDLAHNAVKTTYTLERISAACILCDIHLWGQTGLFDPLFFMYGEDNDLCKRVKMAGGSLLLDTRAQIQHYHSLAASANGSQERIKGWYTMSRLLLRIRYTSLRRSAFVLRSVYYAISPLLRFRKMTKSDIIFLIRMPFILRHWRALKSIDPVGIRNRIGRCVMQDRR